MSLSAPEMTYVTNALKICRSLTINPKIESNQPVDELFFWTANNKLQYSTTTEGKKDILLEWSNNVYHTLLKDPDALEYLGLEVPK